MKNKLKIGEIRYANCTPIYHKLKTGCDCTGYEFVVGEPSALNGLLANGDVDVSSSSSIEYARHWREYLIVPGISISSVGRVGSILLFSKTPMDRLGGENVSVSTASATSTVLLKALLKNRYKLDVSYTPAKPELSTMLSNASAALLIGDEALKERAALGAGSGLLVYDLGELWHEFTGLPFVYALWMMREDSAHRMPALAGKFKEDLQRAKSLADGSYEDIAGVSPEAAWMGKRALVDYWENMSYGLDAAHIKGLKAFFEMAVKLGEVSERPELRFL